MPLRILLAVLVALVGPTSPAWATGPQFSPGAGGDVITVGDCLGPVCFEGTTGNSLQFEGSTANGFETTLTATDPTADRTATLPNFTGTVAMERVYDVRAYGAVCDAPANTTCGSSGTDDTLAIQAAIDAAAAVRGAVVMFPTGVCRFSTLTLDGIDGTTLQGQGAADSFTGTTLCTSTTNATVIEVTKPRQYIRDLSITTGGTPASGQILLHVNGDAGGGSGNFSSLFLERVYMDNFYEAVRADDPPSGTGGAVNMDWVQIVAQVSAAQAVYLGSVELRIDNSTITSTQSMSNALVNVDAGLGRVDTLKINNTTINMPAGATGPSLWIHRSAGAEALQWIEIANATFEGDAAGTDPVIKIDAGNDIKIANSYIYGGQNAVSIAGGSGIAISNTNIFGSGQDCVLHNADAPTWLTGTEVTDCSQASSGTDAGVKLGASSRNFQMVGGRSGNSTYVGNTQGYGFDIDASASSYSLIGVSCPSNTVSCSTGYDPVDDAIAYTGTMTFMPAATGILRSQKNIYLDVDTDNNDSNQGVAVRNSSGNSLVEFNENGAAYLYRGVDLLMHETDNTNYVQVSAPTLSANWTFTWPTDDGNASEVLCNPAGDGVGDWCSITAAYLATDSVSADELNAAGVEAELELVLDHDDLNGAAASTVHTAYTLLAGRAGSGNDTIISTNGTGTIYGSGTTANDLTLRANDDNTTTGEINLNAPRIDLWPSAGNMSTDMTLVNHSPTQTMSGSSQDWTGIAITPTWTWSGNVPQIRGMDVGGSIDYTATDSPTPVYQFNGYRLSTTLKGSAGKGFIYQDGFIDQTTLQWESASNMTDTSSTTGNQWAPISFFSSPTFKTTAAGDYAVDQAIGFHFKPLFATANAGSNFGITDLNGMHAFPPLVSGSNTGTATISDLSLVHGEFSNARHTSGTLGSNITVTNAYGMRLEDWDDATNNYTLWSDSAASMVHGGVMDVGDAVPDLTTNTVSVVDIQPSVDMSDNGTLSGLRFGPTMTNSDAGAGQLYGLYMTPTLSSNSIDTISAVSMAGTVTQTALVSALFSGVSYVLNHNTTYSSATAGVQPRQAVFGINNLPTITMSAGSSSATQPNNIAVVHNPTVSNTAAGSFTLTNDVGMKVSGTYTETAGTLTVSNRIGVDIDDVTNTSSATSITANTGVDVARLTTAASNANTGIKAYGLALQRVDNSTTCTACTDAHISWNDSSFIKLTGSSVKVINGIGGGADGRILYLYNSTANNLTIDNDDGDAAEDTPASQVLTLSGADKTCTTQCMVTLIYDANASRWVVTAVSD